MSDLDKLEKKYEKGNKAKDIRDLAKTLEGSDKAAFGIYPKSGKRSKRADSDKAQEAISQAVAGFKSQWSGLNDEGKVGIGKGTPGIYYNTVAIPAIAGVVDEKYAPDFAVEADNKAAKIREAVRKDMGIDEPRGALQHFAYAGGEMLGQLPVPGALMNKLLSGAKKMGMAGKVATAPFEYFSPTVDPRAINYGIGTTFGGTLGTVLEEPVEKALGGLVHKYADGGGKVGKVATFFSAVDKAINTLKQKKGTGEQILKQLETTPGIKPEELESRGVKQKLLSSPKITQEELQKTIAANKPPIPKRIKLGAGVDPEWQPALEKRFQNALEEFNIEPVVDPDTGKSLGFLHPETGEILDVDEVRQISPEELNMSVDPATGRLTNDDVSLINALRQGAAEAQEQFNRALEKSKTKFGQWSKSKGQNNYREILLQHQDTGVPGAGSLRQRIDELIRSNPATEEEAAAINKEIDSLLDRLSMTRRQFTASHYNQPDVLAHYRVSDMVGPNGEKVLYVDEIQSDWHQRGRDVRKEQIKEQLRDELSELRQKAIEEVGSTELSSENETKIKSVFNRLNKERKAQLEQEIPEDAGYRTVEDNQKLQQINEKIQSIRDRGLSYNELQEYFTPGKIVQGYGGHDRVLSFNAGESSPAFKTAYESRLQQAMRAGVSEDVAANWAKKRALDEAKYDWSVTVIEVDPRTGEPRRSAQPRTHSTSPESEVKNQLIEESQKIERKVPDAPFKKNWHELAVKDILDLAAKEGYEKVAFSPGVDQINRYERELRQTVDSIEFSPTDDGYLLVEGKKGGKNVFNGKVLDDTFVNGVAEGKTMSEVFGAQIAKQIEKQIEEGSQNFENRPATKGRGMPDMSADELLARHFEDLTPDQRDWLENFVRDWEDNIDNSPAGQGAESEMLATYDRWLKDQTLGEPAAAGKYGVIKGDNLTVGGEGMKSFYDIRLPSYIKNYAGKEFKAPTGYMEFENPVLKGEPTEQDIQRAINQIGGEDDDEFMELVNMRADELATEELQLRGIAPGSQEFRDRLFDVTMEDDIMDRASAQALRELAIKRLSQQTGEKVKAFSVDVTPQMKEKITTEGQKLFAATPAIGLGATQVPQQMFPTAPVAAPAPAPAEEEQPKDPPTAPQGFQKGGRIGLTKEAVKKIMGTFTDEVPEVLPKKQADKNLGQFVKKSAVKKRVFHGSNNPEAIVEDKGFFHYNEDQSGIHWLAEDPELADSYTSEYMEQPGEQGAIFPVNISVKKPLNVPFDTDDRISKEVWDFAEKLGFDKQDYAEWVAQHDKSEPVRVWELVNSPQFREAAMRKGFDGIAVKEKDSNTWGVFEPTQIKSQFNQGTYDVKDPDIGKRNGGLVGFQKGGRVGNMKEAAENMLRVLHGSPSRIRLDREKNLDVTTDQGYAVKRAQDKMTHTGQMGPPMVNKFDIPAAKMLRFEETYSPEDVRLMRRFFNKLPEGKAMTGEEIYDAAQGRDFVLEGIARAGGFSGYERPPGGSGGVGNWYRVTDQEALTRKARGGLTQMKGMR